MNYTKDIGWYYKNANNKAPAWTGVEFLYKFLINNKGVGPFGKNTTKEKLEIGDIIQLSFNGTTYAHSLVVVGKQRNTLVATHTFDSYARDLNTYSYQNIRFIHIEGVNVI